MLSAIPTKHLTGITLQGDYNDFNELTDSIHRMAGFDQDPDDPYYGVHLQLLGICYELRHGYMGDREVLMEANGMDEDKMKFHGMITPEENVYYRVNLLFPEAIFLAAALPESYAYSRSYYGSKASRPDLFSPQVPIEEYYKDKARLEGFAAAVWGALGEAVGVEEMEKLDKIIQKAQRSTGEFDNYAIHYIDSCSMELLKTDMEKRADKLIDITRRILTKPADYYKLDEELKFWAEEYGTSIYQLEDPDVQIPEEIEW